MLLNTFPRKEFSPLFPRKLGLFSIFLKNVESGAIQFPKAFAIVIIVLNVLRRLLAGDLYSVLWLAIIIGYYIVPATGNSIRNRYIRAYRYLKSIFKK